MTSSHLHWCGLLAFVKHVRVGRLAVKSFAMWWSSPLQQEASSPKHEHDKCSVVQRVALFVSDCVSRPGGSQRGTRAVRLSSGLTFLLAGSAGSVLISMLCCVCVWACPCARACVGVCCSTCARPRTLPCASTLRVFLLSRNASAHARVCTCGVRALQDAHLRASCARACAGW